MRAKTAAGMVGLIGAAALLAACQPAPQETAAAKQPVKLEAGNKVAAKPVAVKASASKTTSVDAVPAVAPAAKPQEEIVTTMSGCLERDDETFHLKDTSGDHAPKARTWKSGFVKKGSATVDVIDPTNRLNLASHVGHRISISGTLVDREMRARSLRATTESCD